MKETDVTVHFVEKRHRPLDLGFIISVFVFLLLTAGHAKVLTSKPPSPSPSVSEDDGVCHTEACRDAVNLFLKNMNQSVDPCDDFYQYACGNFIKNTIIPSDRNGTNYYLILQDEIFEKLNGTLSADITEEDDKPLRLLKKFHQACMDDENDYKAMQRIVQIVNSLGGWPTLDGFGFEWNETLFDWMQMTQKLQQLGLVSDSFLQVFNVGAQYGIFPRSGELSSAIYNFSERAGVDQQLVDQDVTEVIELKDNLDKINDGDDVCDEELTIREVQTYVPEINWLEYIQTVQNSTLDENETICVDGAVYISSLPQILEARSNRSIANFILTELAHNLMTYYNDNRRRDEHPDRRWRSCLKDAEDYLPIAISSVYVRKHFRREPQSTNDARDILRHLREQFIDMFQKNSWMDDEWKTHALVKLAALWPHIGYPKELMDDHTVEEYYEKLEITEESYFEILLKIQKFNTNKYNGTQYKRSWRRHDDFIQANAENSLDSLLIPAGILHGVFFNKDRPKYMNYGALGSTIAHEISHTFDPSQFYLDQYGTRRTLLQDRSPSLEYRERNDCIIDMYDNYTVNQINQTINGALTLNENVADIVSLKVAYYAYKQWVEEHGEEKRLPGMDMSPKQLFWLSAANAECAKYESQHLYEIIESFQHAPSEARIVNPLKNMPEFAKDYHCPPRSKMNPSERCPIF